MFPVFSTKSQVWWYELTVFGVSKFNACFYGLGDIQGNLWRNGKSSGACSGGHLGEGMSKKIIVPCDTDMKLRSSLVQHWIKFFFSARLYCQHFKRLQQHWSVKGIATHVRSAHRHTCMLPAVAPLARNFTMVSKRTAYFQTSFWSKWPVECAPEVCTLRHGTQCVYHMED